MILFIFFFTFAIHLFESLALSMRYAGVQTKQVASSISFVNVSFLLARLSNMFQAPLLGLMVDAAIRQQTQPDLVHSFRFFLLAAFLGNVLGVFLTPTMAQVFQKGILYFQQQGSIPKTVFRLFSYKTWWKIFKLFRFPVPPAYLWSAFKRLPKGFLIFNFFLVAIYAVGVLSSLLAGAFVPELRSTAIQLSGIVNGIATILLTVFVDPQSAHITDAAVHGKRNKEDVVAMVSFLLLGRLVATLILAQLLLVPAAGYIKFVTEFLANHFHL